MLNFRNDIVIEPDEYILPSFLISPFQNANIWSNAKLPFDDYIETYFKIRFGHSNFEYYLNGRQAIHQALVLLNVKRSDCLTILTTTNNFYISRCVTNEIEKFCSWSRQIEPNTRVIFIIHEFGFPYEGVAKIKKQYNLPIIEDCAHCFFPSGKIEETGKIGDFVIYSFPKMFPIQVGGLLVANNQQYMLPNNIEVSLKKYILKVLSFYIRQKKQIMDLRKRNYNYLGEVLSKVDLYPRFMLYENVIPGVFMFRCNLNINLQDMKFFLNRHGIQSSVFYGEESYFIPVHQNLTIDDLNYFKEIISYFIKKV